MVAMRGDEEEVDIVHPAGVIAPLVRVTDVGFPAVLVGPIEATRMPSRAQTLVEAVADIEDVSEVFRRAHAVRACVGEVADAFDAEGRHALPPFADVRAHRPRPAPTI